jgi:hypothetical protein
MTDINDVRASLCRQDHRKTITDITDITDIRALLYSNADSNPDSNALMSVISVISVMVYRTIVVPTGPLLD